MPLNGIFASLYDRLTPSKRKGPLKQGAQTETGNQEAMPQKRRMKERAGSGSEMGVEAATGNVSLDPSAMDSAQRQHPRRESLFAFLSPLKERAGVELEGKSQKEMEELLDDSNGASAISDTDCDELQGVLDGLDELDVSNLSMSLTFSNDIALNRNRVLAPNPMDTILETQVSDVEGTPEKVLKSARPINEFRPMPIKEARRQSHDMASDSDSDSELAQKVFDSEMRSHSTMSSGLTNFEVSALTEEDHQLQNKLPKVVGDAWKDNDYDPFPRTSGSKEVSETQVIEECLSMIDNNVSVKHKEEPVPMKEKCPQNEVKDDDKRQVQKTARSAKKRPAMNNQSPAAIVVPPNSLFQALKDNVEGISLPSASKQVLDAFVGLNVSKPYPSERFSLDFDIELAGTELQAMRRMKKGLAEHSAPEECHSDDHSSTEAQRWMKALLCCLEHSLTPIPEQMKLPPYLHPARNELQRYMVDRVENQDNGSLMLICESGLGNGEHIILADVFQQVALKYPAVETIWLDGSVQRDPPSAFQALSRQLNENSSRLQAGGTLGTSVQQNSLFDVESTVLKLGASGTFASHFESLFWFMKEKSSEQTIVVVLDKLGEFLQAHPHNQKFLYSLMDLSFNSTNRVKRLIIIGILGGCERNTVLEKRIRSRFDKIQIKVPQMNKAKAKEALKQLLAVEEHDILTKLQFDSQRIAWNQYVSYLLGEASSGFPETEDARGVKSFFGRVLNRGYTFSMLHQLCRLIVHRLRVRLVRTAGTPETEFLLSDCVASLHRLEPDHFQNAMTSLDPDELTVLLVSLFLFCVKGLEAFNFEVLYRLYVDHGRLLAGSDVDVKASTVDQQKRKKRLDATLTENTQLKLKRFSFYTAYHKLIQKGVLTEVVSPEHKTKFLTEAPTLQFYQLCFCEEDLLEFLGKMREREQLTVENKAASVPQTYLTVEALKWLKEVLRCRNS